MIVIDNLDQYCQTLKQLREAIKLLDEAALYHTLAIVATIQRNVKVTKQGEPPRHVPQRRRPRPLHLVRDPRSVASRPAAGLEPEAGGVLQEAKGNRVTDHRRQSVAWEPLRSPTSDRRPKPRSGRQSTTAEPCVWLTGMIWQRGRVFEGHVRRRIRGRGIRGTSGSIECPEGAGSPYL